jgi:hypothetical protein
MIPWEWNHVDSSEAKQDKIRDIECLEASNKRFNKAKYLYWLHNYRYIYVLWLYIKSSVELFRAQWLFQKSVKLFDQSQEHLQKSLKSIEAGILGT